MVSRLPIDDVLDDVLTAVTRDRAVVIQAPPGAGKSTRVPAALLDAGIAADQQILLLEPRRVAARAIASRIAAERAGAVGAEIGWHIRFDRKASAATKLLVVTEGIVTRRLQSDPFLEGVGLVVLDEFHERSVHTDLALAFCRELMEVRDDFAVVVMSATLDADPIAGYLGCSAVRSLGRTHPVDIRYLGKPPEHLPIAVRHAVKSLLDDPDDDGGDILVFLPGLRDIDRCRQSLAELDSQLDVLRLHGSLPEPEQDLALRVGPRRRVVLSTNIAETSLTIEGVTAVIDSGLVKIASADPHTGFDRLDTTRISHASATQRAGRAGRTAPGRAVRLWTQASEFRMTEFDVPQLHRMDLTGPTLDVVSWSGADPASFRWFDPPPLAALQSASETLRHIGLLENEAWRVTDTGRRCAALPLHPRIARFLLAANDSGVGRLGANIAACLAESDWVTAVSGRHPPTLSDAVLRGRLLEEVGNGRVAPAATVGIDVSIGTARHTLRVARDLRRYASSETSPQPDVAARRALLTAYADRIAIRRSAERFAVTTGGSVVLGRESTVRGPEAIVALQVFGERAADGVRCGIVRQASAIEWAWVEELFPHRSRVETAVHFDTDLGRVVARRRKTFDSIILSEEPAPLADVDPATVATTLAHAAAPDLVTAFGLDRDGAQYLDRLEFLRRWLPELDVPSPSNPELLQQLVWGATGFSDLRRIDFPRAFRAYLGGAHVRALEDEAPARFKLPAGRAYRIDYTDAENPVLAAKLQHFFGLRKTPALAGGRIPLLLHLLAPNQRPAQITRDLESFWANTYPEVRKELRARYPKHDWPEHPDH